MIYRGYIVNNNDYYYYYHDIKINDRNLLSHCVTVPSTYLSRMKQLFQKIKV